MRSRVVVLLSGFFFLCSSTGTCSLASLCLFPFKVVLAGAQTVTGYGEKHESVAKANRLQSSDGEAPRGEASREYQSTAQSLGNREVVQIPERARNRDSQTQERPEAFTLK